MKARIDFILNEHKLHDKSFQERESEFELILKPFCKRFTKQEMRDNWLNGIRLGIELGLSKASLEGQKLELYHNIKDPKHKEFVDKIYALSAEYNCAIQYHPQYGMIVVAL